MTSRRRLAAACGVLAPVVAFLGIALATTLSPTFSWAQSALSDTGAAGAPTFLFFNGGLVLSGLLGLPFAWRLYDATSNRVARGGATILAVALVNLGLVGVFHLPKDPHTAVAVTFYLGSMAGQWVYGTGLALADRTRWGLLTMWVGICHLLVWVVWASLLRDAVPGLAVPETVGAALFGAWSALTAWRLLRRG